MEGKIVINQPNYQEVILKLEKELIELKLNSINFFNNDVVKYLVENNTIEIINSEIRSGKKISGLLVLESNTKYGLNSRGKPYYLFKPLDWKLPNFLVSSSYKKRENLFVEIKFNKWDKKLPYGMIEKIFGPEKELESRYQALLSNYEIDTKSINKLFNLEKIKINDDVINRVNLLDLKIITVDPEGCKDMDDAVHYKQISDNLIQVGVHITDVTSYIPINSDIDLEARNRLTSVYSPNKTINMIPECLSENISSLSKKEIKRCISIIFDFDSQGNLIKYQIIPTNIQVKQNLSYDQFDACIKENSSKNMIDLFNFTKKIKFGNFDLINYDSHKMIEKLMILANQTVCQDLINQGLENVIVRTHQKSFDSELEKIPQVIYNDIFFKFMNSAEYQMYNPESTNYHSGLNIYNYTHFTSPIRRYTDMIIHRLIKKRWTQQDITFESKLIDKINLKNKIVKKLDREFKIYQILDNINKLSTLDGYITELNSDTKITVFIPEFKVELKTTILHSKIRYLFNINHTDTNLIISKDNKTIKFEKYMKIIIKLFDKKDTKYKIDINILEPDVKNFIL
jgi:ribonuclease R